MMNNVFKTFDVNYARSQFSFFQLKDQADIAFFDNAAGTFPCKAVVELLSQFYLYNKVQPHSLNALGQSSGEQMDNGRTVISQLLGLTEESITLGASTTQNFNTLSIACSEFIKEDDEIIVTEQDHESNIGCWVRLAKQNKLKLKFWQVNAKSGELDLADLDALLTENTKLVSVTHSSNIIGSINPIREIADKVHKFGAKIVVDGVSFAPHSWPDIVSYGVDAYCFSTYKTYGTHNGVMYISPDFMSELTPQCHFFNENTKAWKLLDSSGPDHASIAALAGLGQFFNTLHLHHFGNSDKSLYEKSQEISRLMHHHENELGALLLEGIKDLPVRLLGKMDMENREANFSLQLLGKKSLDLCEFLGKRDIAISNGHFYAYRLLEKMGIEDLEDGVIRISIAHYNTLDEVKRLVGALRDFFE